MSYQKETNTNNISIDTSSIITQVQRNPAPTNQLQTTPTASSKFRSSRAEFQSVRYKNAPLAAQSLQQSKQQNAYNGTPTKKKSILSRLLCCASAKEVVFDSENDDGGVEIKKRAQARIPITNQEKVETPQRNVAITESPRNRYRPSPARMPSMGPMDGQKICLALDLDETLVHSSFQPVQNASFIIHVNIEGTSHNVYVMKRPGVEEFMARMGRIFEIVIYTASLSKYADPLLDILDKETNVIKKRLFRENCVFYEGHYVKDLSLLNREIGQTIIVDNSPMSYAFHPENAIDCTSFFDDPSDIELWQIADFLEHVSTTNDDVRDHCRQWRSWCTSNPSSAPS